MKYTVEITDTADSLIRKIDKVDDDKKVVTVYTVLDQRQDYLSIIRGL